MGGAIYLSRLIVAKDEASIPPGHVHSNRSLKPPIIEQHSKVVKKIRPGGKCVDEWGIFITPPSPSRW